MRCIVDPKYLLAKLCYHYTTNCREQIWPYFFYIIMIAAKDVNLSLTLFLGCLNLSSLTLGSKIGLDKPRGILQLKKKN